MNIPSHVEIDEIEELQMLEKAVASLASQKLGWKDDLARARISVKMTQVNLFLQKIIESLKLINRLFIN